MSDTEDIKPFRLMDLPPELRCEIFKLALKAHNGVQVWLSSVPRRPKLPPLAQVSSQVRSETLDLFYSYNEFRFVAVPLLTDSDCENFKARLRRWTQQANPTGIKALKAISIGFCSSCYTQSREIAFPSFEALQDRLPKAPDRDSLRRFTTIELMTIQGLICEERGRSCHRIITFTSGHNSKLQITAGGPNRSFDFKSEKKVANFIDNFEDDKDGKHSKGTILLEAILKGTYLWKTVELHTIRTEL